jgi:hypothetical protein
VELAGEIVKATDTIENFIIVVLTRNAIISNYTTVALNPAIVASNSTTVISNVCERSLEAPKLDDKFVVVLRLF